MFFRPRFEVEGTSELSIQRQDFGFVCAIFSVATNLLVLTSDLVGRFSVVLIRKQPI